MPSPTLHWRLAVAGVAAALSIPVVLAAGAQAVRGTTVTAAWTDTSVTLGQPVFVRGQVSPTSAARTVLLQRRTSQGWTAVRSRGTREGDYAFRVGTLRTGEARYRVRVGPTPAAASATGAGRTVRIVRPAARGNPRAFSFLGRDGGAVARWNPCRPIGYRVNARLGGSGALADARQAIARVRRVTGLRFAYRGSTRVVPGGSNDGAYPADTQLVVAWARPAQTRYLRGSGRAGMGGASWRPAVDRRGRRDLMITEGFAVLNARIRLAGGFGRGPRTGWQGTRGQLLMHEIGHAVGLGHAPDDRWEILYPTMTRKPAVWGAGDLRGLSRLGATRGCLSADRSPRRAAGTAPWSGLLT